jgi:hypothetical protein
MDDRTLVMVMVNGIGANLTNDMNSSRAATIRYAKLCGNEVLSAHVSARVCTHKSTLNP